MKWKLTNIGHLKITVNPVIIGGIGKIKKKHRQDINKLFGSSCLQEIKYIHYEELLIYSGEYYHCKGNINTVHIKNWLTS